MRHFKTFALILSILAATAACSSGGTNGTPTPTDDTTSPPADTGNDTGTTDTTPSDTTPPPVMTDNDPIARDVSVALTGAARSPNALVIAGTTAYVCEGKNVVARDTATLQKSAEFGLEFQCVALAIRGNTLVAAERGGEWVVLSTEGGLSQTNRLTAPTPLALTLTDTHIIAALGRNGIATAAISGTEAATTLALGKDVRDVYALATGLLAADKDDGLLSFEISDTGALSLKETLAVIGEAMSITALADSRYVIGCGSGGLTIVELDGLNATTLTTLELPLGLSQSVAVAGDMLMVAGWDGIRLIDASDSDIPMLIATEVFRAGDTSVGRALGVKSTDSGDFLVVGPDALTRVSIDPTGHVPEYSPSQTVVSIEVLPEWDSGASGLVIHNTGRAPLKIWALKVSDERISTSILMIPDDPELDLYADPEEATFFEIQVDGKEPLEATITMKTNVPGQEEITVPVRVNPPLLQVGDPAPDFLLPSVFGDVQTLSDHAGNVVYLKLFNAL